MLILLDILLNNSQKFEFYVKKYHYNENTVSEMFQIMLIYAKKNIRLLCMNTSIHLNHMYLKLYFTFLNFAQNDFHFKKKEIEREKIDFHFHTIIYIRILSHNIDENSLQVPLITEFPSMQTLLFFITVIKSARKGSYVFAEQNQSCLP